MVTTLELVKKNPEPLLKRNAFKIKMIFEGKTPSRLEIKKELSHLLGSKPELTVMRKILTDYGTERAIIEGYFYDDEKTMKDLENKFVMMRHLSTAEQKAAKEKHKETKAAAKTAAQTAKKKK